jgi:hypothetical protein
MPLLPGKKNIGKNIAELEKPSAHAPNGRPYRQALAISLKTAGIPKRADGGLVTGPLHGATGGRADAVQAMVEDGSHVIPSDVVNYLGGGNSAAGMAKLETMFPRRAAGGGLSMLSAPHISVPRLTGIPHPHITALSHMARMPQVGKPSGIPHMTKPHLARGGEPKTVPCRLSDGEYVVGPAAVTRIGGGYPEKGHELIDKAILRLRAESIKHLKSLPKPVGMK